MRHLSVAALLIASAVIVHAQVPRYSEKIELRLVQIEAVVTDRTGNRVHGLTADDFEVFEGRRPQTITNFTEYRSDVVSRAAEPSEPLSHATSPTAVKPAPHTLLVLIDSLPRAGFFRERSFDDVEKLLSRTMRDGDRAGIVYWTPGIERAVVISEPTTDAAAVMRALRGLAGKITTSEWEKTAAEDAFPARAARENRRATPIDIGAQNAATIHFDSETHFDFFRRKISAIRRLITSLGAGPGRKSILYVSNGFELPRGDSRITGLALIDELVRTANASGVTFYGSSPAFDSGNVFLSRVAPATGGLADFGLRSVETTGEKLEEDFDSYYSIAYQATSDGGDRERRISLKPKNREYRVRSRESFVDKSSETMARDAVVTRLFSAQERDDLAFDVKEGPPRRTSRNRWLLPITLTIPTGQLQFAPEGRDRLAQLKILVQAANGIGAVADMVERDLHIPAHEVEADGFVTFTAELLFESRGSFVSIGVMDRRSGLVGVRALDARGRFEPAR